MEMLLSLGITSNPEAGAFSGLGAKGCPLFFFLFYLDVQANRTLSVPVALNIKSY